MIISKVYNPKTIEQKIYKLWEKSGFFNPDKLPREKKKKVEKFVVAMAPLNITGEAHMGHALENTLLDALVRKERMNGKKVLWVPGLDHAGIATQVVIEKELKKQGKTRFDLGREKFIKRIWQWKEKYSNIILDQLKKLGCSCDWSRTRFTMDKNYITAVEQAFLQYWKKGWIYQGERPVNWCSRCQTSLSDLELEYEEKKGKLWYIKYKLKAKNAKRKTDYIVVATTRPETMLGDTAVAVNPKDKRYKNLIGKKVILPQVHREIPIIADRLVDPKFGTGAVKVTPAHDLKDYEISLRHKLQMIQVIDEKGEITKNAPPPYQELKISEARKKIIEDLKKLNFLEKEKNYELSIPKCYRCDTTIEIIPSKQWFLKIDKLAKKAIDVARKNKIKFIPPSRKKIYLSWFDQIRDWCISRQIWWGHKIPIKGVEDVLDTWFSSALWPFATLGWPKRTKDLKNYYPTDLISSAREIFYLWIARMVFSGIEFTSNIPFRNVYTHPTILDKYGKKMSKSLGNVVDPMDLIRQYGTDATRFGLIWQTTGSQDICFDEGVILMGKKFCNKIWNATRFVLSNKPTQINADFSSLRSPGGFTQIKNLTVADKKILKTLEQAIKSATKDLENFKFGQVAQTLYHFFWHNFCDLYIEQSKKQLQNPKLKEQTSNILIYVLLTSMKLLHPFMPFITEEIYQKLPLKNKKICLMVESWPGSK
ncbi:valine--tRNA ligase [Patescibacteria group bacterium]|nr:valine--tRNA ligase [Patescibacteria group bacterium]